MCILSGLGTYSTFLDLVLGRGFVLSYADRAYIRFIYSNKYSGNNHYSDPFI